MQEIDVAKLLEEAFFEMYSILEENFPVYRGGKKLSLKTYSQRMLTKEQVRIETPTNLYPTAWDRIAHCEAGKGFPCALVLDEENHMILVGGSGAAHMNPAVVELAFNDTCIEMTTWAREGFLKQKTAQKARLACIEALGLTASK